MNYLSKITINSDITRSRLLVDVRKNDNYHALVWSLFDDPKARERDFLYHVEEEGPVIYLYSERAPVPTLGVDIETKAWKPQISEGDTLAFKIRVNPVVKKAGKAHDVVMHAKHQNPQWQEEDVVHTALMKWLSNRESSLGISVQSMQALGYTQRRLGKKAFSTVDLNGVLSVTDTEKFRHLLSQGLGKSKGFGCGALLIKRLNANYS